jgi:putative NIF3 family GTP cyclohydrolase 1 type 2
MASGVAAQEGKVTAQQVVERIKAHVGVPWKTETVDTFKAGDPDTPVTGIAVTMMATMEVLERAAASGKNLVITHEPTFYNHEDQAEQLPQKENDAVLAAKRAFIKEHGLVVWRFHDHWHIRKPDGIEAGMVRALGWEKYQDANNQYLFTLPETTVEKLAASLKKQLGIRVMRVVGDPGMKVTKIAFSPGSAGMAREIAALEREAVEVLVVGETREWETVEYVADAATQKKRKALIILGHVPSEQAGMEECARWLKTFVTEVPVEFVPTSEPFWSSRVPDLNLALPQFPIGTQVALARQMIAINSEGRLMPTRITESLQLRVYHSIHPTPYMNYENAPSSHDQDFFEFRMSRQDLFSGGNVGLIAVTPSQTEFATFSTQGVDPFELHGPAERPMSILERCAPCHVNPGIHSVESRLPWMKWPARSVQADQKGTDDAIAWETDVTVARKEKGRLSVVAKDVA